VIVISGVLLLVAVVLLVIGLFNPLAWVYASIAVSVLSFVFLLIGVRQRRDVPVAAEPVRPGAGTPVPAAGLVEEQSDVTVVAPASRGRSAAAAEVGGGLAAAGATTAVLEHERDGGDADEAPAVRAREPRPAGQSASSRLRGGSEPARPVKRASAQKTAARKTAAKSTAKKAAPAKKAATPSTAAKKTTAKKAAPAKKTATTSTAAKKTTAKKAAPAKKTATTSTAAKKTTAKKAAPAKKSAAKKTAR
jgi:DNA-binding protein HU-beta